MKNRLIALLCCFVFLFCLISSQIAFADPITLTAAQVGSAAMAVGSSLGINWSMSGIGPGFAGNWIGAEVGRYDNGESLIAAVSSSIYVDIAGKLVIGQTGYNAICEFIEYIRSKYDLNNALIGTNNIVFDPQNIAGSLNGWAPFTGGSTNNSNYYYEGWSQYGAYPPYATVSANTFNYVGMRVDYLSNSAIVYYDYELKSASSPKVTSFRKFYSEMGISSKQLQSFEYPETYELPTVLNPTEEWIGNIHGQSVPDTNLDDLLGGILEGVEGGSLSVEGEIVEPAPAPTPIPTIPPDTLLPEVPWEGLNDLIGEQTQEITEGLEGIQEEVGGLSEQVEEIAEAIQDEEINWTVFDLRRLFPFCIPFDIYNLIVALDAEPVAPHVQIPFVIQSMNFSYTIDLDFSVFNPVAQLMRTMELLCYALTLAWATSKVIKW